MAFEIGDKVADYEIVGLLGAGAVAEVYKVKHRVTGRLEAMKVLHRRGLGGRQVDRFLREIKLQAGLSHPNIAAVRTALEIDGELLMIMEYVDGQSLRAILETQEVDGQQALDYILQALAALEYAHQRGITHRDVTPSNMLITADGKLKLTDFGLAKATGDPALTQTGTPLGSLYYMSPEHVRGLGEADQQSDIYSLGAVLYELITGKPPFDGKNAFEVMRAQVEEEPRPPRELVAGLDSGLNETVLRALAKDPRDRFASVHEFQSAVSQARQGGKRPWSRGRSKAEQRTSEQAAEAAAPESAEEETPGQPKFPRWWAPALGAGLAALIVLFIVWQWPAEQPPAAVERAETLAATGSGAPAVISGGSSEPAGSEIGSDSTSGGEPTAEVATNDAEARPVEGASGGVAPGGSGRPSQGTGGEKPATRSDKGTPARTKAAAGVAVARSGSGTLDLAVDGNQLAADDAAAPRDVTAPDRATTASAVDSRQSNVADESGVEGARLLQSLRVPRLSKLAVTADGTLLAGAAEDRIVRVWNTRTGRVSVELEGHVDAITALAFTPDGRQLASGDASGLVKLWDLDSERDLAALNQRGAIQFITFSRDGQWMAAGSGDESVGLWKRTDPAVAPSRERVLKGHKQVPMAGAFSPDSSHVVTASNESTLMVWAVAGDDESRRVAGLDGGAGELSYSASGRWLGAAGERSLTIWDASHYEQVRQVDVPAGRHAIAFTPDGLCLVATATFRRLVLWEATSGGEIAVLDTDIRVQSMALTPSGDRLMVADANGGLRIWEIPAPDPALLRTQASPALTQSGAIAPQQGKEKDSKLPGLARRVVDLFH